MSNHNLSRADQLLIGRANYLPISRVLGAPGVPIKMLSQIDLGAPDVADANGICESQDLTAAGVASVNTTAAAAIAAAALAGVMDVPRGLVAAWTGAAVLTVTGTDVYGNVLKESSASGTSFAGKKAFKTVTNFAVSANVTALTIGTSDVLGLPYAIRGKYDMLALYADGADELAASVVVGAVTAAATATTGDVRGTINPDTACDGSVNFRLWAMINDPNSLPGLIGVNQYAG